MHHDQVKFIPGMHCGLTLENQAVQLIISTKEGKPYDHLSNAEKAFNKIQYLFMIKNKKKKLEIGWNFLKLKRIICKENLELASCLKVKG